MALPRFFRMTSFLARARAWVAVLVVLLFGVLLVRQTMPAYRPLPGLALVGLVAVADLIVLQAIVFLHCLCLRGAHGRDNIPTLSEE